MSGVAGFLSLDKVAGEVPATARIVEEGGRAATVSYQTATRRESVCHGHLSWTVEAVAPVSAASATRFAGAAAAH